MFKYVKHYYDRNYYQTKICEIDDYVHNKVWNSIFDEVHDIIYVFVGHIKKIEGERIPMPEKIE